MVDPITGRRADQMSGQEAAGPGSPGAPGRNGGNDQNGTSVDSSHVPFWASGGTGRGERAGREPERTAPAEFGRSRRTASSAPERTARPELAGGYSGLRGAYERGPSDRGTYDRGISDEAHGGQQRAGGAPDTPGHGRPAPHHHREIEHLAHESRLPAWRRRLIIAVVLGIVFTIFTNWRIGLTVAVLAAIADAFIRSRSSAASAAEGLTSGAQRRTKKELGKLERSGFRSLHIRAIPGSDQVIDHLLVGPTGVYAIDSEEWDKRLPVRTKNGRQLWHGPYSQKERLQHACWEAAQASDLIGNALGEEIPVRPAMAVYGPAIPWGFATIRDVDVFSGDKLRKYLRRHRAGRDMRLDAPEIERIYTVADKVLPPKR
jgi:hypothetical protein